MLYICYGYLFVNISRVHGGEYHWSPPLIELDDRCPWIDSSYIGEQLDRRPAASRRKSPVQPLLDRLRHRIRSLQRQRLDRAGKDLPDNDRFREFPPRGSTGGSRPQVVLGRVFRRSTSSPRPRTTNCTCPVTLAMPGMRWEVGWQEGYTTGRGFPLSIMESVPPVPSWTAEGSGTTTAWIAGSTGSTAAPRCSYGGRWTLWPHPTN